jgi:anti-anti-sigma regulatory factor
MASPAAGATPPSPIRPSRPAGRLGSEEFNSSTLPTAQEAAVLYAANHAEAAANVLKAEIKDAVGRNNKQAWLMLFDLYQVQQNKQEFESLSMLFTVKFEQSPPAWSESSDDSPSDPRRNQSRERKDFFALKANAAGELAPEIEKFRVFAEGQGTVRLDVSKITTLTTGESLQLASVLNKLRKTKTPMWFNSLDTLEKALRAAFNEKPSDDQKSYWILLFELLILQGKPMEYEELGLEFAVAFEMSPPNWEVYVNTVAAEAAKATAGAKGPGPAQPPEAGYALKGVLSPASNNQIAELNAHAATKNEVAVDMGKVLRVEFTYTATFFDTVKAIQLAGKRVILTNLNELNAALLEALGVNRYAILVRRR